MRSATSGPAAVALRQDAPGVPVRSPTDPYARPATAEILPVPRGAVVALVRVLKEFGNADLEKAKDVLARWAETNDDPRWQLLAGILEEVA